MKHSNFSFLHFLIVSILLLASNISFAAGTDSSKTWDVVLKTFKTEKLSLTFVNPLIDTTVINEVEVIDVRPDTSNLGMFANSFSNPVKMVFADGSALKDVIEKKLSSSSLSGCSVMIVVKDFWMLNLTKSLDSIEDNRIKFAYSKLVLKADVFIKENDLYYPLSRLDTTFYDKRVITTSSRSLMKNALEEIHFKIKDAYTKALYIKRKNEKKSTIVDFYSSRLAYKSLDSPPLKKGIFLSFEQFKKNATVYANFELRQFKDEPPTLFVIDNKGNYTLERKVWGVFDGKDTYIMDEDFLFKLYQTEKACYWIGFKAYNRRTIVAPAAVPLGGGWTAIGLDNVAPVVNLKLVPKLLNLNTGKEY